MSVYSQYSQSNFSNDEFDEIEGLHAEDSKLFTSRCVQDDSRRSLGVLSLAVLTYYGVSGGPFGIEPSVQAGGPLLAIVGFLLMPLVWSVPEALITAELSSTYPEASGFVAWVEEAFGEKAGLVEGYLSWMSGVTDNAIYPILFLEYLLPEFSDASDDISPYYRTTFMILVNIALTYINYRGLKVVGTLASVVAVLSLSPFILMCLIGVFKLNSERLFKSPDNMTCLASDGCDSDSRWFDNVKWSPLLNNIFWNVNYFDSASAFAGDVKNPGYTWPRAMFIAVLMVVLNYLLPLIVAIGATQSNRSDWNEGYLTTAATSIGGDWLGAWTVFAAAISNLALYQAEMSADSFQLMGMAERGLIPVFFGYKSSYNTPTYSLVLGSVVIVIISFFPFMKIVEILNLLYCFALILEFAAFIKLRISAPNVERPFRIPLSIFWCIAMLIPATSLLIVMITLASWTSYLGA